VNLPHVEESLIAAGTSPHQTDAAHLSLSRNKI